MECRFSAHPRHWNGKIIRLVYMALGVPDANNRSMRGVTGETLLQLLETRIDNVVYRLGLANTRSAARQLVSHGHVMVNGRSVNVASYNVKAGDEITIKDKPKSRQLVLRNLDLTQIFPVPDWLTVDRDALSGKVTRIPSREEIQPIVNEQLIVELYSR